MRFFKIFVDMDMVDYSVALDLVYIILEFENV